MPSNPKPEPSNNSDPGPLDNLANQQAQRRLLASVRETITAAEATREVHNANAGGTCTCYLCEDVRALAYNTKLAASVIEGALPWSPEDDGAP